MSVLKRLLLWFIQFGPITESGLISECIGSCLKPEPPKPVKPYRSFGALAAPKRPSIVFPNAKIPVPSPEPNTLPNPVPKPTVPINPPFTEECTEITSILPLVIGVDSTTINNLCRSRFVQLNQFHRAHQRSLRTPVPPSNPINTTKSNLDSYLIVLDLDETIMDQSTFLIKSNVYESGIPVDFWKKINSNELIMNFNDYEGRLLSGDIRAEQQRHPRSFRVRHLSKRTRIHIGIFRKYFMRFIAFTQSQNDQHTNTKYDIMLYSAATSDLLIYHAVTIELYYNFVYAATHEIQRTFHFESVVARPDDIRFQKDEFGKRKSLDDMHLLFGNKLLDSYRNIIIVDDMENHVWNKHIPTELVHRNFNILCLAPIAFSFENAGFVDYARYWNGQTLEIVREIRNSDTTFDDLIAILQNFKYQPLSKENHLVWVRGHRYREDDLPETKQVESNKKEDSNDPQQSEVGNSPDVLIEEK